MPKTPKDAENFSPVFQNRIIAIMSELDMNQKQFAAFLGISQPVVNHIVKYGIYPSTRVLIKIANVLNYPLGYVLGESDKKDFYESETPVTFHERLKQLATERNVKYSQIAYSINISKDYFYEWQRLKTLPSLDFLKKIADYFHVSLDYILGRTDER